MGEYELDKMKITGILQCTAAFFFFWYATRSFDHTARFKEEQQKLKEAINLRKRSRGRITSRE